MRRELEPDEDRDHDVADRARGRDEDRERDDEAENRARDRVRFERVAAGVERVLAPNPTLHIEDGVSLSEERGLEELLAAARGDEQGQPLSGLARMERLNRALAMLRPALVAGQHSALHEQRRRYAELAERVGELRHRITQRIGVEAVVFGAGKKNEAEKEEEDGDDAGESEAGREDEARDRHEGEG